jgi:hypothetical protein
MERMPGNKREQRPPVRMRTTAERPPGKVTSMEEPSIDKAANQTLEGGENRGSPGQVQSGGAPATDAANPAASDGTNSTGSSPVQTQSDVTPATDTANPAISDRTNSTGSDNPLLGALREKRAELTRRYAELNQPSQNASDGDENTLP